MLTAKRYLDLSSVLFGFLLFVLSITSTVAQTSLSEPIPYSPTEKWVLYQVSIGEIADLEKKFDKESDRTLDAKFVEDLLTNSIKDAKVHRHGARIANAVIRGHVDLQGAEIPFTVRLNNCRFEGDINFSQSSLARNLILDGSIFNGFIRFFYTEVKGYLSARNAQFNHSTEKANFNNLKVGDDAFFDGAIFAGPVDFIGANINGNFQAEGTKFNNSKEGANFASIKVRENIFIRKGTIFEGPVVFVNADVNDNFDARRTHFNSKKDKADFTSMIVGKNAFFSDAVFNGPTAFINANIAQAFEVDRAIFRNSEYPPNFKNMEVGIALFNNVEFKGTPDFTSMAFKDMDMTSWEGLLSSIRNSKYRPDVYANLEAYYRKAGYVEIAKDIHIRARRHERDSMTFWQQPLEYSWNFVQDVTSGYGQRLERALLWSACFIIIGCLVFRREDGMETQKKEDQERCKGRYRPFWYSLALFLPIISLEDAKIWTPKMHRRTARLYMRFHIILGYLLIPIGLAAWTGILK